LILIGRFNAEEAIPLSTTLICGSSIANFIQMCRQRHPIRNKPLIDYDLALMLEPLSLVGTVVGVILNTMFPDWLLLILLIILLLLSLERTLVNGIKLWKQEKSSEYTIIPYEGQEEELSFLRGSIYNSKLARLFESESKTHKLPFVIMIAMLAVLSILGILKGTSIIGTVKCSLEYWIISFASFPFLILMSIIVSIVLVKKHRRKCRYNYQYREGDIQWTPMKCIALSLISFVGGTFSGLLGLGGGIIFGPVMLELGVLPFVASATSSFLILFTSTASIFQYAYLGRMITDYSIWYGIIGFTCSLIGQTFLTRLVKKYKKTSLIVLCIAVVIGLSTIFLIVIGVMNILDGIKSGESFGFTSICS